MSKPILIYNTQVYKRTAFEFFLSQLAKGFQQLGQEVQFVWIDSASSINNAVNMLINKQVAFTLGMNDTLMALASSEKPDGIPIYENIDTMHVSVLQDAPYSVKVGNISVPARRHLVCYLDRSHRDMLFKCAPDKKFAGTLFLPMAGSEAPGTDPEDIFSIEKKYDVVYCAGYWGMENVQRSWNADGDNPANTYIAGILNDVADFMETNTSTMQESFEMVLSAHGFIFDDVYKNLVPYFWPMLNYIKCWRRMKAMEFIVKNDIKIDVFGGGWDQSPFADKLNIHGRVSYEDSLRCIAQGKVLYQDQAEFNDGAHDRVFAAMLNGTAVVSEYSQYLEEQFTPNHEIYMYDWKNGCQQVQVINELLNDDYRRLSGIVSAYGKVDKNHRWINRAERILEAVEILNL